LKNRLVHEPALLSEAHFIATTDGPRMTLPLRKDHDEALADVDLRPRSTQNSESDEERKQEGPELVRADASSAAGEMNPAKAQPQGDAVPFFVEKDRQELQRHWDQIQTGFVDQPRNAVHEADALVSSAIDRLSKGFADARSKLEQQWDKGDNVSTEDLRVAFQRYRSFFQRMLSI